MQYSSNDARNKQKQKVCVTAFLNQIFKSGKKYNRL